MNDERKELLAQVAELNLLPEDTTVGYGIIHTLTYDRYHEAENIAKLLPDGFLGDVLDYGCGIGDIGIWFLARGCGVDFFDFEGFRKIIEHRIGRNLRGKFLPVDSILAKQYDLIVCNEVLEHVKDALATLTKLMGVLKSGGYLMTSNFPFRADGDYWKHRGHNSETPKQNMAGQDYLNTICEPAVTWDNCHYLLKKK